jgi:hypothetical protein
MESVGHSPPICHIDKLPNEILRLIFSLLVPSNDRNPLNFRRSYNHSSIIAIRRVSRCFRVIANDLDFWYEDSFDFKDHWRYRQPRRYTQPRQLGRIIRKLLNDDGLNLVLSRKAGWQFSCLQALLATAASIPGLSRNTRSVTLTCFEQNQLLDIAIDYLTGFSALTQLTVEFQLRDDIQPCLNLTLIIESCPFLETLVITHLREHLGSLAKASKLQKLEITFGCPLGDETTIFSSRHLPANSAQSLKSLGISIRGQCDAESFTLDLLDSYVNLAEFKSYDLKLPLCKMLTHGKFTLSSLDVTCTYPSRDPSVEALLAMFYAPSFKYLRYLAFDFDFRFMRAESDELVSAIATLRHLESLNLKMICCTSWLKRFAQLRHLKSILLFFWRIEFDDYDGKAP